MQIVALKFIPKLGKSGHELQALQREIAIMQALRHENIVALYDWIETDTEVPNTVTLDQGVRCDLSWARYRGLLQPQLGHLQGFAATSVGPCTGVCCDLSWAMVDSPWLES